MALEWNVSDITNAWDKVSQSELDKEIKNNKENPNRVSIWSPTRYKEDGITYQMRGELQTLIFLTMNVGLNKITKKNYVKFYNRLHFLENQLGGTYLTDEGKPHPFTMDMIEDCIGLETNANNLTKSQFVRNATRHTEL